MVIATDAGLLFTFSDLRPEGEKQNPNAGQAHEDTAVNKEREEKKKIKFQLLALTNLAPVFQP